MVKNNGISYLYSLLNIDRLIKSRRMRNFENVLGMRKKTKRPLLSPVLIIWEDIIKVGYKEGMGKEPLGTLGPR